jgi:hypothetical protein
VFKRYLFEILMLPRLALQPCSSALAEIQVEMSTVATSGIMEMFVVVKL